MPTYTPETRQLYIGKAAHDRVREYATAHGVTVEEVYRRLIGEIATVPGQKRRPEREPKVRATPKIPDAVWEIVQTRSLAERVPIAALVEQRIDAL